MRVRALAAVLIGPVLFACVQRDDGFLLLRRRELRLDNERIQLAYAQPDDATALHVRHLLSDGFGAELLRTYAMARRLSGHDSDPVVIALGDLDEADGGRYRERQFDSGWFTQKLSPEMPMVWLDERSPTSTLAQLVEGFGTQIANLVAMPGCFASDHALRRGYVLFLLVVAGEWQTRDVAGAREQESLRALSSFAAIRANTAVMDRRSSLKESSLWVRPGNELVRDPVVVASLLYRMAASELGRRMAPEEIYRPFLPDAPPRGIHPALLLGAFRNFQAKLFTAWQRAAMSGSRPANLVDLVEAYGDAFPAERAAAVRTLVVTTYGATVLSEPRQPLLWPETAFAALTADVLFGTRGLRDALGPKHHFVGQ
jgi:hypothetical protein